MVIPLRATCRAIVALALLGAARTEAGTTQETENVFVVTMDGLAGKRCSGALARGYLLPSGVERRTAGSLDYLRVHRPRVLCVMLGETDEFLVVTTDRGRGPTAFDRATQSQVAATVALLRGEDYLAAVPNAAPPLPGAVAP